MTSRAIERVERAIAALNGLQGDASLTAVERVDLADIRSDLDNALEKLQALQTYQLSPETDYEQLWKEKKAELKDFERARDAWIRTEIFSQMLQTAATPH